MTAIKELYDWIEKAIDGIDNCPFTQHTKEDHKFKRETLVSVRHKLIELAKEELEFIKGSYKEFDIELFDCTFMQNYKEDLEEVVESK